MNPAPLVADMLRRSAGAPLAPELRTFFEARFGCDLGHVRVHIGEAAAGASDTLRARAFAVGGDIVFAAGAFQPESFAGRVLLAHELVHVVQQRERALEIPEALGRPDDPIEREADEASVAVMAGRSAPRLTRDAGRQLRRAVQFDAASAGIDLVTGEAAPQLTLIPGEDRPVAVCNLTKDFNTNPKLVDWAFRFGGHVNMSRGPTDKLDHHTIGFVQYLRHNFTGVFYAGRRKEEGSISMLLHPIIGTNYLLDLSPSTTSPFMWPPQKNSTIVDSEVDAVMGDHPVLSVRQRVFNTTKGVDNFLFHIVDDREIWSIFTLRDPSGKFQHLAHVHWTLRYEFKLQWRNNQPVIINSGQSKILFDETKLGAPTDADLAPVLAALSPSQGPIATPTAQAALSALLTPPNPNRTDNPEWFLNVPSSFFQ